MLREFSDRDDRPNPWWLKVLILALAGLIVIGVMGGTLIGFVAWLSGL
jgi:hypothetical protein